MTDYMGKKQVDKETFAKAIAYLEAQGAEKRGTAVGDPPTCVWRIDGENQAQYFVAWIDDPETFYVKQEILDKIKGLKDEST